MFVILAQTLDQLTDQIDRALSYAEVNAPMAMKAYLTGTSDSPIVYAPPLSHIASRGQYGVSIAIDHLIGFGKGAAPQGKFMLNLLKFSSQDLWGNPNRGKILCTYADHDIKKIAVHLREIMLTAFPEQYCKEQGAEIA